LIERAYRQGEAMGLAVWTQDEAGPYQTLPYPGHSWQAHGSAQRQPHEYHRNGTAKLLTLFHPASGELRANGVRQCTNEVLHPWLKQELSAILATLPTPEPVTAPQTNRTQWQQWQAGRRQPITLPQELPTLRMLMVLDNLQGHKTPALVLWLFAQGLMPLCTPLGGSWLNMAESIQRIISQRALAGQHPQTPEQIIALLEATVQGWNQDPTPFEWGGKRHTRRQRSRQRRYMLGGSGACTHRPLRRRPTLIDKWLSNCQMTH
jgi:DDE superfamily endonuclease